MLAWIAIGASLASQKLPSSRFEWAMPLALPAVKIDAINDGIGLAQQMARARGLQGRILWIDGTANLGRCSSDERIRDLVAKVKSVGFNTIVYDVKPISGQVLYPSKIAPKIEKWKTQSLPKDFDPLRAMAREAKANKIPLLISLNAFSEGHNLFMEGPGYAHDQWQTVIYEAVPVVIGQDQEEEGEEEWVQLHAKPNEIGPEGLISVFTDPAKLALVPSSFPRVFVDRNGRVVAGPRIPAGGSSLVGTGKAAHFLAERGEVGTRLRFDTNPRFVRIGQRPEIQYPLITNPLQPEVRERNLAIIAEILQNYDVDGIVYDDRLRYAGLYADFSALSTSTFEKRVGRKLAWPDDVFKFTLSPTLQRGIRPGPYFDAWMTWRAEVMRDWVDEVARFVKQRKPGALFGVYAGSWYGEYQQYGNNYASQEFTGGFWFNTDAYRKTGFANRLDLLMTGCYYNVGTIFDAMQAGLPIGPTVEAAGQLTNRAARDMTWAYAGISLDKFKGDPDGLGKVLQAACASTQGVMVFDLSHDIEPMWPVFAQAFRRPAQAPHQVPGLLDAIRAKRKRYDAWGVKEPPVPISSGSTGVGF